MGFFYDERATDGIHLPFGKYRHEPVAILAYDLPYAKWLLAQEFFPANYRALAHLTANIVREQERRIVAREHDKAETVKERVEEVMLLVRSNAGPGLCTAFIRLQLWLDDANAGP